MNCVRRREPCRAAADARYRAKRVIAPTGTSRCFRVGRLHAEAVIIERNRILEPSVESGSRRRFAGRKVEAGMMPRAADGSAYDNAFV